MITAVPLRRLVDNEQWEAEDVAGRLGIVGHAAFLRAGFVPCGDEPSSGCLFYKQVDEIGSSAPSLSRRYTAPELARRREGAPAPGDVAVLELRAGTNGDVAFRAYLLMTDSFRVVDDEQWKAEDIAGRLGVVAHAAFLHAGFVPYGDEPSSGHLLKQVDETGPSAPSISRWYTLSQLARRRKAASADDVAVQEVRALGNGVFAFRAFLLTTDGQRRCLCEAVLDAAALVPLLSRRLDRAVRALEAGSKGAWLWKSLADWVCSVLLDELCGPVTVFTSLPDDAKAEILKRFTDSKDLARVECTSKQLRKLVADRDAELWKARYESLMNRVVPEAQGGSEDDSEGLLGSWKERYVNALRRCYEEWMAQRRRERQAELRRFRDMEI